jgi:putative nucleotidyltransferase with HDIG domain
MRLLSITKCLPGMRLGKNIFNEDGRVLLGVHMELTESLIRRLQDCGVDFVCVEDERTDDIIIPNMITDRTRSKALSQIRSTFKMVMEDAGRRRASGSLAKEFKEVLNMVLDDLSDQQDAMVMLLDMNVYDHYLYQHSLNVCIYACSLGMHIGYSRNDLYVLGLGALLHDIGKTKIPLDILNKKEKLTPDEYSIMQLHAELGYKVLKEEANIPLVSAHCALQHHERMDGSGYPRGIEGSEIHEFAQWIGLVDSYDAMTSHRVYRRAILPHQAIESLYAGAGTLYSVDKIAVFRDKIAMYPLGVTVSLNTGESGVVVDINSSCPHRPIIRILEDHLGQTVKVPYEIDMSKQLSVMIADFSEHEINIR